MHFYSALKSLLFNGVKHKILGLRCKRYKHFSFKKGPLLFRDVKILNCSEFVILFIVDVPSVTEMRPCSNTCQTDSVGTGTQNLHLAFRTCTCCKFHHISCFNDEGHDTLLNSRKEEEDLYYASVTVVGCSQGESQRSLHYTFTLCCHYDTHFGHGEF